MTAMNQRLDRAAILVMVVLYAVGFVGMHTRHAAWFVSLTPVTLLVSIGLLVFRLPERGGRFWLVAAFAMALGYGVEVLGVHTGAIFGTYQYGQALGWKLFEVPLLIAVNWLLLLLVTGDLVIRLRLPMGLRVIAGALAMMSLDILIEPVAISLNYWTWDGGTPPIQNFIAWFVVSLVMHAALGWARQDRPSPVAMALLILQTLFFIGLNSIPPQL